MLVWGEVPGAVSYVVEWDYKGADTWGSEQRGTQGALIKTTQPVANFKFIGAQPGRWRVWASMPPANQAPRATGANSATHTKEEFKKHALQPTRRSWTRYGFRAAARIDLRSHPPRNTRPPESVAS